MKSFQIRRFPWSVLSQIWTEYGDLLCKSAYSTQMRENTDQKKAWIQTFLTQCIPRIFPCSFNL